MRGYGTCIAAVCCVWPRIVRNVSSASGDGHLVAAGAGTAQLVQAACTFGNSVTLPLIFLAALLPAAEALRATGCAQSGAIPVLWSRSTCPTAAVLWEGDHVPIFIPSSKALDTSTITPTLRHSHISDADLLLFIMVRYMQF